MKSFSLDESNSLSPHVATIPPQHLQSQPQMHVADSQSKLIDFEVFDFFLCKNYFSNFRIFDDEKPTSHCLSVSKILSFSTSSLLTSYWVTAFFPSKAMRKQFGKVRMSSMEMHHNSSFDKSGSPSPCRSPIVNSQKPQRLLPANLYVALYNFISRHEDEISLKAGSTITVTDTTGRWHCKMEILRLFRWAFSIWNSQLSNRSWLVGWQVVRQYRLFSIQICG